MTDPRPIAPPLRPLARGALIATAVVAIGVCLMFAGCQSAGEAWILGGLEESPEGILVEPGTEDSALSEQAGLTEFRPDTELEPGVGLVVRSSDRIQFAKEPEGCPGAVRLDVSRDCWSELDVPPEWGYVYPPDPRAEAWGECYTARYGGGLYGDASRGAGLVGPRLECAVSPETTAGPDEHRAYLERCAGEIAPRSFGLADRGRPCQSGGAIGGDPHGALGKGRLRELWELGPSRAAGGPETHVGDPAARELADVYYSRDAWSRVTDELERLQAGEPTPPPPADEGCRLRFWNGNRVDPDTCDEWRLGYWPCCWIDYQPGPFSSTPPGRYCAAVREGEIDPRCDATADTEPPPPPPPPDDEEPPPPPSPPPAEVDLTPVTESLDRLESRVVEIASRLQTLQATVLSECGQDCAPCPPPPDCNPVLDCASCGGTPPPSPPPVDPPSPPPPSELVDVTADFLANNRKRTVPVSWSGAQVHVRVDANSSSRVDQQPTYPISPAQVVFGCLRPAPDPKRGKGLCIIRQPDKRGARLDNGQNVSCGNEGGWQIDHRDGTISERCGLSLTYQATLTVVDDLAVDLSLDPKFETDGAGNPTAWFVPRSGNIRFRLTPVAQQRGGLVEAEAFELPYALWGVRWGEGKD